MKANRKMLLCFLLFFQLFMFFIVSCKENTQEDKRYQIGVIFYGDRDMQEMVSESIFQYADYIEARFPVDFHFVPTMNTAHLDAVEQLCQEGVDAILNANTQSIPESIALCEKNEIYWLQFLDKPADTDVVDRYKNSQYYLGSIVNNDAAASETIANHMISLGIHKIGLVSLPDTVSNSSTHSVRYVAAQNAILNSGYTPEFLVQTYSIYTALESMAIQGYQPQGLITATKSFQRPHDELKELFRNQELKFSYFDLSDNTRDELESGETVIVSCGQHNLFGLSFAYTYHCLSTGKPAEEKLDLSVNYLFLKSPQDYDDYIRLCINDMPYGKKELEEIINSLDSGRDTINAFADNYSLDELRKKK